MQFNDKFFEEIGTSPQVEALLRQRAEALLDVVQQTAPRDTGDYVSRFQIEKRRSRYRTVLRVVGRDPKTLLLESRMGILARALRAVRRRG